MHKSIILLLLVHLNAYADKSDFLNLCQYSFKTKKTKDTCKKINSIFFSKGNDQISSLFSPDQVQAPSFKIDKKIQFIVFNDPNYFPGVAYCYFVFRGFINPRAISPDQLGSKSSGFSILNEDLDAYELWLNKQQGKACRKLVERESKVPLTNLKDSLKGHIAMIGINPYASVVNSKGDFEKTMADLRLTVNHERIHAFQASCRDYEAYGQHQWSKLSLSQKKRFQSQYPAYNWGDIKVAGREFIAFTYELKVTEASKLVKTCPFP